VRALLLAAGEGTRLRPLTLDRPKPMLPIGGRPILEHLIDLLRRHGVTEIAINLHYKPEVIVDYFGNGARFGVSITYSREPELLGSAGAVKRLADFWTETFLVLYGDVLTNLDLTALVAQHWASGAQVTVALYEVEEPTRCGIVDLTDDGRIVRFVEKPAPEAVFSNLANAGIYVVEPEVLRHIPADQPFDFGRDLFPVLLEAGVPLSGHRAIGYVLDIGSSERYQQAEADWQAGRLAPDGPVPDGLAPSSQELARPTRQEVSQF
jgi:NDP-sugar pyrophosphorylase family protein